MSGSRDITIFLDDGPVKRTKTLGLANGELRLDKHGMILSVRITDWQRVSVSQFDDGAEYETILDFEDAEKIKKRRTRENIVCSPMGRLD